MSKRFGTWLLGAAALASTLALAQEAPGWELRVCSDPNNMPYSNEQEEGFENRIAEILADELGAELSYVWYPQRNLQIREVFREGECDLIMGVSDGSPLVRTTLPYYQSTYVFVYRDDADFEIESLDDPDLQNLRIGVQVPGGESASIPPTQALANRGLSPNFTGFSIFGNYTEPEPLRPIIDAVVDGEVDVSVVWGPVAGYFAKESEVPLTLVPVTPQIEPPFLPMVFAISAAVRQGDEDFADLLDRALTIRWDDVQAVLEEYNVPVLPVPRPTLGGAGQ
jgi:mxaJ protein